MEQYVIAIDVYDAEEYKGTYEVAECEADEIIEQLEKEGLEYELAVYQYYVPGWHYFNKGE